MQHPKKFCFRHKLRKARRCYILKFNHKIKLHFAIWVGKCFAIYAYNPYFRERKWHIRTPIWMWSMDELRRTAKFHVCSCVRIRGPFPTALNSIAGRYVALGAWALTLPLNPFPNWGSSADTPWNYRWHKPHSIPENYPCISNALGIWAPTTEEINY